MRSFTEIIGNIISKSNASVRRYLKVLKDNNLIEYAGARKSGGYKIISKNESNKKI
jgi:predicted transcriptional regulator